MKGFRFYALVSLAIAGVAAAIVAFAPIDSLARVGAWAGVGLAVLSGALALLLKRGASAVMGTAALSAGLKSLGLVFLVRLLMLGIGLFVAARNDAALSFVCGFFGVYLAQQWVEVSYLLGEQRHQAKVQG